MVRGVRAKQIITQDDKNLVHAIIERIIVEKDMYLRLRLSLVLIKSMKGKISTDLEDFQKEFEDNLYGSDLVRRILWRERLMDSDYANVYLAHEDCDKEFRYDEKLESKICRLEMIIDEFISVVIKEFLLEGNISFGN